MYREPTNDSKYSRCMRIMIPMSIRRRRTESHKICRPKGPETIEKQERKILRLHWQYNFVLRNRRANAFLPSSSLFITMDSGSLNLYSFIELFSAVLVSWGIALYPPLLLLLFKKAWKIIQKEREQGTCKMITSISYETNLLFCSHLQRLRRKWP